MAKYRETFESETVGAAPSNFTEIANPADVDWVIAEDGASPSSKVLKGTRISGTTDNLLQYTPVVSDPDNGNVMVLMRVRRSVASGGILRINLRQSSGTTLHYQVDMGLAGNEFVAPTFREFGPTLRSISNVTQPEVAGSSTVTIPDGEWFYIRVACIGNQLYSKLWREVDAEPTWVQVGYDVTFSATSNANLLTINYGTVSNNPGVIEISDFAVSTGVDAADFVENEVGARVTQSMLQVATKLDAEMRTSQSYLHVANKLDTDVQVSQSNILALWGDKSDLIQYSQAAILVLSTGVPCVTRWQQLWTITRLDGTVFRFTTLDVDFVYGSNTYNTCGSLAASAAESATDLSQEGNVELSAILSSDYISEQEVLAGLFDAATVEVWVVPWDTTDTTLPYRIIAGEIGRIRSGTVGFQAEIITPAARANQQNLLQVYTPQCRHKLGDSRCKVDLDALQVSGSVTQTAIINAPNVSRKRAFFDSSRVEATGYFNHGELTFTSGDNSGVTLQVETYDQATGQILLWDKAPYTIGLGDTYTMKPGCDKTTATCSAKFSNIENYGGFPHVPGIDGILAITTRQSEQNGK
jgi:uncharacterized phage protein (TIGR02218 family)